MHTLESKDGRYRVTHRGGNTYLFWDRDRGRKGQGRTETLHLDLGIEDGHLVAEAVNEIYIGDPAEGDHRYHLEKVGNRWQCSCPGALRGYRCYHEVTAYAAERVERTLLERIREHLLGCSEDVDPLVA